MVALAPLLANCAYFSLKPTEALHVLADIYKAVNGWRAMALAPDIGLTAAELDDFAPAFEHEVLDEARAVLA